MTLPLGVFKMTKISFIAPILLLSMSAFANNAVYNGDIKTSAEVKDIKHAPDAIVLKDFEGNEAELVVFYRYSDDQKSGFSLANGRGADGSLMWASNGVFTNEDTFKTSSIAPAPIQYNDKLYLFGITKNSGNIIYNTFSSVDDLLLGNWETDNYLYTGKEANRNEGKDTISLLNYDDDIMMTHYKIDSKDHFGYVTCDDIRLECSGVGHAVEGYKDPTSIATVVEPHGKERTLLFVREAAELNHDDVDILHLYEYKIWPNQSSPRWGFLYRIGHTEEIVSGAVLNGVQVDDIFYLYFKRNNGSIARIHIHTDEIDNGTWSTALDIKDPDGQLIDNVQGGPKAVIYGEYTYVFYVDKSSQNMKYFAMKNTEN